MKNQILLITLLCSSLHFFGQQTYYTTGLGSGEFNDPASWTLTKGTTNTPLEAPSVRDNIEINHYLSHFTEKNYTHYGNVTVGTTGTYEVITGLIDPGAYIFAGEVFNVSGTLITINDFQHQLEGSEGDGVLIFGSTSLIYINGDLVMNASGQAVLNNTSCGAGQTINDLHFKGVGARICGSGTFIVPNKIRAWDAEGAEVRPTQAGVEYIESLICNGFNFFQTSEACEAPTSAPIMIGTGQFNIESSIVDFKAKIPKMAKLILTGQLTTIL